MNNQRNKYFILLMLVASVFASCKKQWDQHDKITDPNLTVNLLQQINNNPNLSSFSQYLAKSKYAGILSTSKTYTVFAPNNTAMKSVDATILTDTARLNLFVGNQIAYQSYTTNMPQPSLRVQMINGKYETFSKTTIELGTIVQADGYASNGIIQITNHAILPKLNLWDYMTNTGAANGKGITTDALEEQAYLISQNYTITDTALATVIGINSATGKPILKPGTGLVNKNSYKDSTADASVEANQYTTFVLTDAGFDANRAAELKYFTTSSTDSTSKLVSFNILKDLIVPGVYSTKHEPGTLPMPDTIISLSGVKVPINMNDTLRSYNASNGRVYIMKAANFRLVDKIPTIIIQGESDPVTGTPGSWFARTDKSGDIYYRIKNDPNGVQFKDIFIEQNTGGGTYPPPFWAGYPIQKMNSVSYKVYIRAINDTKTLFSQQITFGAAIAPAVGTTSVPFTALPYKVVSLNNYVEVYLGTYTHTLYGYNSMFLVGNATSTTTGQNSLTMDYVKLVPILQ